MIKLQALPVAVVGTATAFAGVLAVDGHAGDRRPLGRGGMSIAEGMPCLAVADSIEKSSRVICQVACGLILLDAALLLVVDSGMPGAVALALLAASAAVVIVLLRKAPRNLRCMQKLERRLARTKRH